MADSSPDDPAVEEKPEEKPPIPILEKWMGKSLQWGTRAKPGKKGMTLNSLNIGIYGEVPEYWEDESRMPRGAYPVRGFVANNPTLRFKYEQWADNAADLYEEAIQRRWASSTKIPWDTIRPLPEDVEIAMCQLCTELSQQASMELDIITSWLQQLSYGFYEVKAFLATEVTDAARHCEAFRKRAWANGGGLGLESRGEVNRMMLETRGGWSEACVYLYLMRGSFTLALYRHGEAFAHNPAEKALFSHCIQDKARHISYGLEHLRYSVTHKRDNIVKFNRLLEIGEFLLIKDLEDPVLPEALAVIFGGGVKGAKRGMHQVRQLMGDFVNHYLSCSDWLGLNRRGSIPPELAKYLEI
ncbi:MAG: hypothetical protein ACE5KI_05445 [Dehalococcoidia bacterium]